MRMRFDSKFERCLVFLHFLTALLCCVLIVVDSPPPSLSILWPRQPSLGGHLEAKRGNLSSAPS